MERKINAGTKHKWRSQPDLGAGVPVPSGGGVDIYDTDRELHALSTLSGVRFDHEVFKIVADLLRLNVNPNTLLDVLRKMAMQSSQQREDNTNRYSGSSQTLLHKDNDAGGAAAGKREAGGSVGSLGSLDTVSLMSNYSYLNLSSSSKEKSRSSRSVADM